MKCLGSVEVGEGKYLCLTVTQCGEVLEFLCKVSKICDDESFIVEFLDKSRFTLRYDDSKYFDDVSEVTESIYNVMSILC